MTNLKQKGKAVNPTKGMDKIWNRRGIIEISMGLIKSMSVEAARVVFRDIFVIDTENKLYTQTIKYFAISPLFRELEEGDMAPEYRATTERFKDGHMEVRWEEVPPFTPEVHDLTKNSITPKSETKYYTLLLSRLQNFFKRKRHDTASLKKY